MPIQFIVHVDAGGQYPAGQEVTEEARQEDADLLIMVDAVARGKIILTFC